MRRSMMVLLSLLALALVPGCAYVRTFTETPDWAKGERVVGIRTSQGQMVGGAVEGLTVVVVESDRATPYCSHLAGGITCEFPTTFLLEFANLGAGGWRDITFDTARAVCAQAMHTTPMGLTASMVSECGWALVELRWREAMPPTDDKNQ